MRKPQSDAPFLRIPGVREIFIPVVRRRALLTALAVILLALLFCLILCGEARADASSPEAAAIQARFLSHFESRGYTVRRDGSGHPNLERTVTEEGGSEEVTYVEEVPHTRVVSRTDENGKKVQTKVTETRSVTRSYARQLGEYSGSCFLDLQIAPFEDAGQLATELTMGTFPRMERERRQLEERAESWGTVLNSPGRKEEVRWPQGDGWAEGLRVHEDTPVFQESKEGYLYGHLESLRQQVPGAPGESRVGGDLNLVFWTDQFLFRLKGAATHSGSGNLEWKADGGPRPMDLVSEAYRVITGKELALSLPESLSSHPALVLEASPSSIPADGRSTSILTVTPKDVTPDLLEGQELSFQILPEEGHVPGSLSGEKVLLAGGDPVSVTFTAPDVKAFPDLPERATIRVSCAKLGLEDRVSLTLERYEGLDVAVEHDILPAHPDYYSALTFSFGTPGENEPGGTFEAVIRAASSGGRLLTPDQKLAGEVGAPELTFGAAPGAENVVYYHFVGEPPQEGAVAETVSFNIPAMDYREDVSLSVGIDLAPAGAEPLWNAALSAGMAVPFKVRVEDRFHPGANLKELFDAFGVKPDLRIVRKSPVPVEASGPEDDLCSRLLHHVTGSVMPGGASIREVVGGVPLRGRGDDGGWCLAETSTGGGTFFPGVIPWDGGNYQFEVVFVPRWDGDAADTNHSVVMAPLEVSPPGAGGVVMDDFFIPTLRFWAGLAPSCGAVATAWDVAGDVHERGEKPRDAALAGITALASSVAQDLATAWEGDSVGARALKEEFRAHVSKALDIPPEKLDDETFEKTMKAVADRYWAGSTFDALFAYVLDRAKGSALPDSKGPSPGAVEGSGGDLFDEALTFGSAFLKGKGGSVVLAVGPGAGRLTVWDGQGQVVKDAPNQMFLSGDESQRVYRREGLLVVPSGEGDTVVLEVPPGAESLNLYRLRGDGHSFSRVESSGKLSRAVLSGEGMVLQEMTPPEETLSPDPGEPPPDGSLPEEVPGPAKDAPVPAGEREETLESSAPSRERALPEPLLASVTGDRVNFRSEPTVSSKVLAMLARGEQVEILKEWVPPSKGEAVLVRPCEVDVGKETVRLPDGFGIRVTEVDERAGTVQVTFRHGDDWVSGTLARDAVSSTKGDPWFLARRQDGTLGWAFGKYVETDPRKPDRPGPEVQVLYEKGLEFLEDGKDGEALFCLDQALELYPGHVDALFARGRCLAAMKRYEEAVESFWEIPFYAPAQPRYLPWTGYCWQAMGRYEKALLAYGAALKLHPDHEIARAVSDHVAQCREALGLPAEALPSDKQIRAFLFDRWDDHIAEDIWQGSLRGKGLWETW